MKKSKSNALISDFNQKQSEFGYIESFNLNRSLSEEVCSEYVLKVTLIDYPFCEGDHKFLISFSGVRGLKIGNLEGLFKLDISISDITEDQMEGINYKVKEEENELFSFYCEKFEFEIL